MDVRVREIRKSYGAGETRARVLDALSAEMKDGTITVILGPSGSGKSTLLNVIGGLDTADEGSVQVGGVEITGLTGDQLCAYRRDTLGFVFQFYNLIGNLTVRENVEVCRYLARTPLDTDELLKVLGLSAHRDKYPSQLSGGQQQRCAIARALVKNPGLLLCDEPTGALDSRSALEILSLIEQINRRYGTTVLLVTHNEAISGMAHQVIRIRDGRVREACENASPLGAESLRW